MDRRGMRWWWDADDSPIRLRSLTEPAEEPVTYEAARDHLHLSEDSEAGQVDIVMRAAREAVEGHTGRALIKRQVRQTLDYFPAGRTIKLAASPLLSTGMLSAGESQVVVRYYPQGSTATVWSSTNYIINQDADPPVLVLARDQEFPNVELRTAAAVEVDYFVGYSTGSAGVPDWARMAVLLTGSHYFLNREAVVTGTIATKIPMGAESLMALHRSPLAQV